MTEEERLRSLTDAELETWVLLVQGSTEYSRSGLVIAEHTRRQREYAEAQEESRREFEQQMFNAEGERQLKQRQWQEALAERQIAHATALAQEQTGAARSAARAARLAAWATAVAAAGAVAQAIIAALK